MTKRDRAIELRDLALTVVKARGTWQKTGGGPNLLMFRDASAGINIAYRTPFQKMPEPSAERVQRHLTRRALIEDGTVRSADLRNRIKQAAVSYEAVSLAASMPKNLPYGLDVWCHGKVLNVEWSDQGDFKMVGYKAGDWEQRLLKVANDG